MSDADIANVDTFYLLYAGSLVFFMQAGFAMLCAGSVRAKNVKNIMLKNILDACAGALGFWSIGYTIAYGGPDNEKNTFIGYQDYWFMYKDPGYIGWFFQFAFAATAATIVAGTVAERCKMSAYACYSIFLTAWVYPVVVHSGWSYSGWFSAFSSGKLLNGMGVIDFAGSGIVHATGGCTALVAAIVLGPRIGRFYDADGNKLDEPHTFPAHSVALQVLGTFILWFGWYGFNPGSTLAITPPGYGQVAALCAVTTTLSAAAGCVSALIINVVMTSMATGEGVFDLTMAMNGALSGLVGITAGCSVVQPWAAVVIGMISGLVYVLSSKLLVMLEIDDAVDAIPVHFFNGMWGVLAVGFFAHPSLVSSVYGFEGGGVLYGESAKLLLNEFLSLCFIVAWVVGNTAPFFMLLKVLGLFRVDALEEEVGLDISHHGGAAYDMSGPAKETVDELVARKSAHMVEAPVIDEAEA